MIRDNIDFTEKNKFKKNLKTWKELKYLSSIPNDLTSKRTFTPKRRKIDLTNL